jgi:hypothetical protein
MSVSYLLCDWITGLLLKLPSFDFLFYGHKYDKLIFG